MTDVSECADPETPDFRHDEHNKQERLTTMNGRQIRDAVRDGIITPEQAAKLERQPKRVTNGWQRAAAIVIASLFVAVIIGGLIALLMLIVRAIGSIL